MSMLRFAKNTINSRNVRIDRERRATLDEFRIGCSWRFSSKISFFYTKISWLFALNNTTEFLDKINLFLAQKHRFFLDKNTQKDVFLWFLWWIYRSFIINHKPLFFLTKIDGFTQNFFFYAKYPGFSQQNIQFLDKKKPIFDPKTSLF